MTEEVYKPVRHFPDYRVSNRGRILNIESGKTIKPRVDDWGFLRLKLCKLGIHTSFAVHRLVAEHFLPDFDPKKRIAFLNGDKTDCRVENLTQVEYGARGRKRELT